MARSLGSAVIGGGACAPLGTAPTIGAAVLPLGWEAIFLLKALYATVLLATYTFIVPETRPGKWSNVSPRAIVRQFAEVIGHRIEGRGRLPIRRRICRSSASPAPASRIPTTVA